MGFFKGKNAKTLTMMVAIAAVIVLSFVALTNAKDKKAANKEEEDPNSELELVLNKDLDSAYPSSVREVIKFYCRVLACMFNEKTTDDQMIVLIDQERKLFDKQLLKENVYSEFVEKQKTEVLSFKNAKSMIVNYQIQDNDDVKYWHNNESECAAIIAGMNISGTKLVKKYQKFILRKDDKDNWKILGYDDYNGELTSEKPESTSKPQATKSSEVDAKKK